MSGFIFPPPPPPPPKPSNGDSSPPGPVGNSARGRGRGRNRGGQDFRGRGGRGRGNFSQSRGQHQGNRPPSSTGNGHQVQQDFYSNSAPNSDSFPQYGPNSVSHLPPGSYINPAFHQNVSNQPTPHQYGTNNTRDSPQRTVAGHKRKLKALRGPTQDSRQPVPPTAPSIPSFGSPIFQVQNGTVQTPTLQNKRSLNMLGLTPQDNQPQYSSDSDDDDDGVDEEAMYAELGTNLAFEHNGTVMALNTAADLAAWKEERQKNFPTKKRLAEKVEEKRRVGEERTRLLTEASQALRAAKEAKLRPRGSSHSEQEQPATKSESELEKGRRELAEHSAILEQLRKRVAKSEERAARARDQESAHEQPLTKHATDNLPVADPKEVDALDKEHDDTLATTAQHDVDTNETNEPKVSEAAANAIDQEIAGSPSISSRSRAAESDDDDPPEEASSTRPVEQNERRRVCKFFAERGSCKDGAMCINKHERGRRGSLSASHVQQRRHQPINIRNTDEQDDAPPSSNRMTIFDRLVEQEREQEDRLALQAIKYLGQVGMFSKEKKEADT